MDKDICTGLMINDVPISFHLPALMTLHRGVPSYVTALAYLVGSCFQVLISEPLVGQVPDTEISEHWKHPKDIFCRT